MTWRRSAPPAPAVAAAPRTGGVAGGHRHRGGAMADGDLDHRVPELDGTAGRIASDINRLLDCMDAFVRETQACLVAGEVKQLADESTTSSGTISLQVAAVEQAAAAATAAIGGIAASISEIDDRTATISHAVAGSDGLASLAGRLQESMSRCTA